MASLKEDVSSTNYRFSKLGLSIKEKVIYSSDISISPSSLKIIQKKYGYESEEATKVQFTYKILKSEYIGDCIVAKYKRMGHLVKVENDFFIVISMTGGSVFYVSQYTSDFEMIGELESTEIVVAGEKVDVSKIQLGHHFIKMASERLKVSLDDVRTVFLDTVVKGTYICVTRDKETKKPAHLFIRDGILVYVSLDFEKSITIYSNNIIGDSIHSNVKDLLVKTLFSEIKKLNRQEEKISKRNEKEILHHNLRIAEIKLEQYYSRSASKIARLEQELKEIDERITEIEEEWNCVVDDIRRHAVSLASFM